jgi:glutaconate CoA-transferase subunit A
VPGFCQAEALTKGLDNGKQGRLCKNNHSAGIGMAIRLNTHDRSNAGEGTLFMNPSIDKVMTLKEAVDRFVFNGAHISIGGFTVNRNPMAAVYEIMRQQKSGLHLYAHSNGQGVDELIGGGCVGRLEIAYAGNGRFAPTCIRFRKAVQSGNLQVEDYSNYQMTLRFAAGAMGLPFLPVRSGMGTDIVSRWGFPRALRQSDAKLPDLKLAPLENPFGDWGGASTVLLVPAITPDVTIIHVQMADRAGTVRMEGLPFSDVEQAKAARRVIVTCEELVDTQVLRRQPESNQLPFFCVDAVVPVPYGAYPTACYRYYDYDPVFLNAYRGWARDEQLHADYLKRCVHDVPDHAGFLELQDPDQLARIKADPRTGYATGLDRR